jgi:hypothetical protein
MRFADLAIGADLVVINVIFQNAVRIFQDLSCAGDVFIVSGVTKGTKKMTAIIAPSTTGMSQ